MSEFRYSVTCDECGEIVADTSDDGLFSVETAHRRAGHHEGAFDHECTVEIEMEIKEYRCPICHTKVTGKRERDEHASGEPGLKPSGMVRV